MSPFSGAAAAAITSLMFLSFHPKYITIIRPAINPNDSVLTQITLSSHRNPAWHDAQPCQKKKGPRLTYSSKREERYKWLGNHLVSLAKRAWTPRSYTMFLASCRTTMDGFIFGERWTSAPFTSFIVSCVPLCQKYIVEKYRYLKIQRVAMKLLLL